MLDKFKHVLKKELERVDSSGVSKKNEVVIEGFSFNKDSAPKAIVKGKNYTIFNSNDYLGLRFDKDIIKAEHVSSSKYGSGPGAVRFISGSLKVHKDLENALAEFHGREDCIVFSSAFAVNFGVLHALIKGQSKDSLVNNDVLVVSDELNHRSIIDGIRVANLPKENKAIFKHKDLDNLKKILTENKGKFKRVLIITDGIFSMLGDYQDIKKLNKVINEFQNDFEEGIISVVDDAHGVGCFGSTGRGVEELCEDKADVLIGTLGKGFGVDGGYVVGDKLLIDYLRESTATYIYSNPLTPGSAGAALKAVKIVNSKKGKTLIKKLNENIKYFEDKLKSSSLNLVIDSKHAIQPVLIGDPLETKSLVKKLYQKNILVTNISYPIVPKGKDEIRIQLNSTHTKKDIDELFKVLKK